MKSQLFVAVAVALFGSAAASTLWTITFAPGAVGNDHKIIHIKPGDQVQWTNNDGGGHEPIPRTAAEGGDDPLDPLYSSANDHPLPHGETSTPPVTYTVPGIYYWIDFFNPNLPSGAPFRGEIIVDNCGTVCGDPHFIGLDNVHYDFQGRPGQTFAIISDPSMQMNVDFVRSLHGDTVLGDTCIRTCGHTVAVSPQKTVYVDGKEIRVNQMFNSTSLFVDHYEAEYVHVIIPGRWNMRLHMHTLTAEGAMIELDYAHPLYKYDGKTHGVLGHTMAHKFIAPERCNIETEGSCEVEGGFADYEIKGDLCSTEWKYSQFKQC